MPSVAEGQLPRIEHPEGCFLAGGRDNARTLASREPRHVDSLYHSLNPRSILIIEFIKARCVIPARDEPGIIILRNSRGNMVTPGSESGVLAGEDLALETPREES